MWLESHGNLARHPKTRRLMQRMGWTLPATIGNLHLLWYWALEYAPTGDLTKFDSKDLTYDLDLGDSTPEQFIEALIASGFLDKSESGTLRLHDWPQYTAKSVRPKFRRNPERWHQVLRSYGLPVIVRRKRSTSESARNNSPAPEQQVPTSAERDPELVGMDLRAVRGITGADSAAPTGEAFSSNSVSNDSDKSPTDTRDLSRGDMNVANPGFSNNTTGSGLNPAAPIPKSLSDLPGFADAWWPKFQEMYKIQGSPLNAFEQGQALAKLAQNPSAAIQTLKGSIKTLMARPELAIPGWSKTRPAVQKRQVENTS